MLTGAITADPFGVLVAFGAGIISFLSPCVLPLVPGYLSMVSGLSAAELAGATGAVASVGAGAIRGARPPMKPLLRGILLFVAGFTLVFVVLGAAASGIGQLLDHHKDGLITVSGAVVVALGTVLLASCLPPAAWSRLGGRASARAGWLLGERRVQVRPGTLGTWAAPVMGMAFAFAWTPCIGPVLGAVSALAASRSSLAGGVLLLFAYSLGLGVPFVATGVAFNRLTGLFARARRPLAAVQVVAGAVLVAFGVVLLAGDLGWLSAQFTGLLDHIGLQGLTTS